MMLGLIVFFVEFFAEPIDVSMIFSNFDNKRFYCYHCLGKNDLGEAFSIITDVHSHWIISHMQSAKPVPFLFVISDCFACHVCGTIQIYHDLLKHANNNHPAIIVDKIDQKQCALCAYNGNDIIQHFQKMHKSILKSNNLNPMRLTAKMFEELLTIDVHKQLECEHCQQLFDTKTQVQLHHKIKHSTEKVSMKKVFNNQVIYLICGYCDQKVESDDYFSHVSTHIYPWKCLHCDFHAIDLDDLMEHDELEHSSSNIFDDIFKNHSNLLEMNYFQTKVVFGNGLVLIKHNLIGTKIGDRPVFDQFMIEYGDSLRPKIDNAPPKAIVNNKAMESDSDVSINEEKLSPVSDDCVITDVHQEENNDLKEQNILDKNVSIYGIPNSLDSELNEVISNLCKTIGTNLTSNDIRRIYRLPGELNEVIINFKTYEAKSEFMHAKWPTDQIELAPDVQISSRDVRHHMTDFYLSLSAMVCKAKEKNLIVSCELTRRGIAFKRTDSSETEYIRTEYEAQKILNGLE